MAHTLWEIRYGEWPWLVKKEAIRSAASPSCEESDGVAISRLNNEIASLVTCSIIRSEGLPPKLNHSRGFSSC